MRSQTRTKAIAAAFTVFAACAAPASATALLYGDTIDVPVNQNLVLGADADPSEVAIRDIAALVARLMDAMARKDYDTLKALYVPNADAVFFSGGENWKTRGTERFLRTQIQCLTAVGAVEVLPYDMQMQFLDDVVITTLTGQNHMKLAEDRIAKSSWRWSLVFRRSGDSEWRIAHEHFSHREE
ncbi:YybH family protein [Primorskyibacter sp. 2E107]|uniref:YybH family protein n=1 Tax=Primorskyibacter sp. 2E107 TaxID=3403458 RepID=UPI003AF758CF